MLMLRTEEEELTSLQRRAEHMSCGDEKLLPQAHNVWTGLQGPHQRRCNGVLHCMAERVCLEGDL